MFFISLSNFIGNLAGGLISPKAYIDPNTGGMLFQVLAALLAVFSGILFFFSRQIKSFVARIRRKAREKDVHNTEESDNPEA